jgi:hypothetical protein
MILVGGVALALVFVALGVLLNSAAFSGAEAARAGALDAEDALSIRDDAVEGIGGALYYVNNDSWESGYPGLSDAIESETRVWSDTVANMSASHRTLTNVTVSGTTKGTQIYQHQTGNFESADGDSTWTLAPDVNGARQFGIRVDGTTGLTTGPTDAFRVVFDNGNTAELSIYESSGTVTVDWATPDASGTCDTGETSVSVAVTAGKILDGSCTSSSSFPAFPDLSGSYNIRYENASRINGGYTLIVDEPVEAARTSGNYNVYENAQPHAVAAFYDATVRVQYAGATLTYEGTAPVRPQSPPDVALSTVGGATTGDPPDGGSVPDIVSPVAPPPPRQIVFVHGGTDRLMSIGRDGDLTRYATKNAEAIGPMQADLDGDGLSEIPYVTSGNELKLIDRHNETQTLVSSGVEKTQTLLGVGTLNDETDVFYANDSENAMFRVSPGESAEVVLSHDDGIAAVAGIADFNNDGDAEPIWSGSSQTVRYYDNGETQSTQQTIGQNNGIGIGQPQDLDGDGRVRMPVFDTSSFARLLDSDGSVFLSSDEYPGSASPLAAVDWTGDETKEVLYANGNSNLAYLTLDGSGARINDSNGDPIPVDDSVGVA